MEAQDSDNLENVNDLEQDDYDKNAEARRELGKIIDISLLSVSQGIKKGITNGFAETSVDPDSRALSLYFSFFSMATELLSSALTMTAPGGALERSVKSESFMESEKNKAARRAFSSKVVGLASSIYNDNFSMFVKIIKDSNKFEVKESSSEHLSLLAKYKNADDYHRASSSASPYKMILKEIIPISRGKFEAIVSAAKAMGPGVNINSSEIGKRYSLGIDTSIDKERMETLYEAIVDWHDFVKMFSSGDSSIQVPNVSDEDEGGESHDGESAAKNSVKPAESVEGVESTIIIKDVVAETNIQMHHTDSGIYTVELEGPSSSETPVLRLDIVSKKEDESAEAIFEKLINLGMIELLIPEDKHIKDYIIDVILRPNDGANKFLYVAFNYNTLSNEKGDDVFGIMRIYKKDSRPIEIVADDSHFIKELYKLANSSNTTPLYETVSPSGERVSFTAADLVVGKGKVRDSKGKSFKPKKRKGKSLADRVNSKSFGKVKRRG